VLDGGGRGSEGRGQRRALATSRLLRHLASCNLLGRSSPSRRRYAAQGPSAAPRRASISRGGPFAAPCTPAGAFVASALPTTTAAIMPSAAPVDLSFARALPKIEVRGRPPLLSALPSRVHGLRYTVRSANLTKLHAHLTGSISRACLHDIWEARRQQEPQLELQDPLVAIPPDKVDYDVQTYGLFSSLFRRIASALSHAP
jgi:hypothetical protein